MVEVVERPVAVGDAEDDLELDARMGDRLLEEVDAVAVAEMVWVRWQVAIPIEVANADRHHLHVEAGAEGGGGAGPFHSQSLEATFLHVPGLKVVVPAWPEDAYSLLREAIRDPNPVLFFEHKYLYRRVKASLAPASIDIGAGVEAGARIVRPGDGVSVFTWGWMVHRAVAAAEALGEEGISVEVGDLRVLAPLDERTVMESVGRTGRALVVHEAQLTGGFGGEIAARIAEGAFEALDAPVRRLAYPDHPVPFNKELEAVCLPDEESIAASLRELAAW